MHRERGAAQEREQSCKNGHIEGGRRKYKINISGGGRVIVGIVVVTSGLMGRGVFRRVVRTASQRRQDLYI